jgi:cell wall-associated NlpC family hydrolase
MSLLADAARAYNGTRFRHRGRNKKGIDCAGLVWAAYNDLGVTLPDFRLYGREPHRDGLTGHVSAALGEPVAQKPVPLANVRDGDVLVIAYVSEPHHLAIVGSRDYDGTQALTMIHASGHDGRVLEQRLTADVRITHVFRRPV